MPSLETSEELLWTSVTPCWPSWELGSSPVVMDQSFWSVKGSTGSSRTYPEETRSSSDCGNCPLSAAYWSSSDLILKRSSRKTVSRACVIVFPYWGRATDARMMIIEITIINSSSVNPREWAVRTSGPGDTAKELLSLSPGVFLFPVLVVLLPVIVLLPIQCRVLRL